MATPNISDPTEHAESAEQADSTGADWEPTPAIPLAAAREAWHAGPKDAHSHGAVGVLDPTAAPRSGRRASRDPEYFGVPTGREEDWRFTPLARLSVLLEPLGSDGALLLESAAAPGVQVSTVGGDDPRIGTVLTPVDRVSALAMAAPERAIVVSIPAGHHEPSPTYLTIRGEGGTAYGHLFVEVGAGASAVVVVDHVGSTTLAANTEISLAGGASLTFLSLQNWDDDAVHLEAQAASLGADASLRHGVVTLGGDLVRLTNTVRFAGRGGRAELLGVYFTDAGQHQEHRVFIDHAAPDCYSRVTYKGAQQGDGAQAVWVGDVEIRPEGTGTDTYELNRNLLLTDGARAHSVPNLEIETGEVAQAGHASASGRFDDLQLFYLQSRGIPADVARRLVVRGFFAEVIDALGVPEVAERLVRSIDAELAAVGV